MASGCGCGGGNGGSGGCGSSAKAAPVADVAPVGAVQFEPVVVDEAPPQLIASSEQEWPILSVNGVSITPQAMAQELQYHPAQSREDAVYQAARALVIRELLQQRIAELGLSLQVGAGENEEEAATRLLLEREVQVPQCDEATCLRYYESNRARFHSAPLLAVRHILLECAPDDAEGRSLAYVQAELLLERLDQAPGTFAELAQTYSACPSKEQGGSLGQISKGQTVPELERQLFALPAGLWGKPLESRYGWHVISIDQRIDGQPLPYEAVATAIRTQLQQGVWQKALVQYLQTLIGAADIRGIHLQGADSPLVQ
ncbi:MULTISPECIES: peptidylprolyl isomerase [unclassified Pseudomonas]|uniref:peptidylprolyl isomerase n=1 Tax=unclassified Pseudomonas TaxID=196821 RepID=UPI00119B73BE|nr:MULTISPECIES: peptidylprolyl isomerase [unclassified Pseudomonas]TWC15521.1 peptidyl-prolyl cis-trans isomerase C [Pseudomonas sp. SJZ075]TWC19059.1 peptidyl-prolyl cis-trans isomerase C [Pseudomonas sp. SJZ074]TWC30475.1 peptidyl-prolyl cis-trans isomerase C [Pseudomonas sp. SJZ078]TWC36925.1 peptidyl-prolyl cis-trans isomerase C [Pseudomonas sp. SJZ085]TWC53124.1 peptidyl-prolyl cis-trans isomerase C [Pseudomonas sp. SJZ124]